MHNKSKKTLNESTDLSPSRCYRRNDNVAKNDGAPTHGILNTGFRKIVGLDVYIQIHIHLVHQA